MLINLIQILEDKNITLCRLAKETGIPKSKLSEFSRVLSKVLILKDANSFVQH